MDETEGDGDDDLILRDESILIDSEESQPKVVPPSLSLSSDKPHQQIVSRVATEKTLFHKASFSQMNRMHGSSGSKLKPGSSSFDY